MDRVHQDKLARATQTQTWSIRACVAGVLSALLAAILAVLDYGGKDATLLAAIGFFLCFVAITLSLSGLFGLALARETPGVPPIPRWIVRSAVGGILLSMAAGLFGLVT